MGYVPLNEYADELDRLKSRGIVSLHQARDDLEQLLKTNLSIGLHVANDEDRIILYSKGRAQTRYLREITKDSERDGTLICKIKAYDFNTDQIAPLYIYVLLGRDTKSQNFEELTGLIRIFFNQVMQSNRTHIRRIILNNRLSTIDLNSFLHKCTDAIKTEICRCEAVSFFIFDKRVGELKLRQSTGLASGSNPLDISVRSAGKSWVAKAYTTQASIFEFEASGSLHKGKTAESLQAGAWARAYLPIRPEIRLEHERKPNRRLDCSGVLRILNPAQTTTERVPFSAFDLFHLMYLCEIIHVNIAAYVDKDVAGFDKDLAFHAAASVVDGIVKNIDMARKLMYGQSEDGIYSVQKQFNIEPIGKFSLDELWHLLSNAYAFGIDIQAQIERANVGPRHAESEKSTVDRLLSDVLISSVKLCESIKAAHSVKEKVSVNKIFQLPKPPPVYGKRGDLVSLFKNLLDNSIKYKKPGHPVQIHFDVAYDDNWVTVEVRDNGIGVGADDLENMFHPGFRSERARQHRVRGNGLGLAYCQEIVRNCNGKIWAEQREDGLSIFVRLKRAF